MMFSKRAGPDQDDNDADESDGREDNASRGIWIGEAPPRQWNRCTPRCIGDGRASAASASSTSPPPRRHSGVVGIEVWIRRWATREPAVSFRDPVAVYSVRQRRGWEVRSEYK